MIIEDQQIEEFRKYLEIPDLHILLVDNDFPKQGEFRRKLRQEVYEYFDRAMENGDFPNLEHESQIEYDFKEILDLDKVPHPQWGGLSISHCPTKGVFISSFTNKNIGVDIEQSDRLQKEPILRVCTQEEVDTSPSLAHLWTAKEAAFKSYYRVDQPKVLSEINVFDWNERETGYFHFRFEAQNAKGETIIGEGLAHQNNGLNLSVCRI